jgi:hypothetical protein
MNLCAFENSICCTSSERVSLSAHPEANLKANLKTHSVIHVPTRTPQLQLPVVRRLAMPDTLPFIPSSFYRCAGPNCGVLKGVSDRWWIMWSSFDDYDVPVMHLAPWDEKLAVQEGALHVCGEGCAQKLQSQFMGNVLESRSRRSSG